MFLHLWLHLGWALCQSHFLFHLSPNSGMSLLQDSILWYACYRHRDGMGAGTTLLSSQSPPFSLKWLQLSTEQCNLSLVILCCLGGTWHSTGSGSRDLRMHVRQGAEMDSMASLVASETTSLSSRGPSPCPEVAEMSCQVAVGLRGSQWVAVSIPRLLHRVAFAGHQVFLPALSILHMSLASGRHHRFSPPTSYSGSAPANGPGHLNWPPQSFPPGGTVFRTS